MKDAINRQDAIHLIYMLDLDEETLTRYQQEIPEYYAIYQKLIAISEDAGAD